MYFTSIGDIITWLNILLEFDKILFYFEGFFSIKLQLKNIQHLEVKLWDVFKHVALTILF